MADHDQGLEQNREQSGNPYIKEKIRRKRFSPMRFIMQVVTCLFLAVIFGAAASIAFVVVRPWAESIGPTEESSTPSMVELPTYPQNTSPQGSEPEESTQETTETTTVNEDELNLNDAQKQWIRNQISSMIDRNNADIADLDSVDMEMNLVYSSAEKSLATITGYGTAESTVGQMLWQTKGAIFYKNDETHEILILADASAVTDSDDMRVMIPALPGRELPAVIKGWDHIFGLAVFSVSTKALTINEISQIRIMEIGNSYQVRECDTVLFTGRPYGMDKSVAVGRITFVLKDQSTLDSLYRLFYTDVSLPEQGSGFMINTAGQLVGILLPGFRDSTMSYGVAVGTEELKGTLNSMMNGMPSSLIGIYGRDVTEELAASGMPKGVYVSDVQVDGPAYKAGISAGDIITGISMSEITCVSDLTQCMTESHLPEETVIVQIMRMSPEGYKPMEISVTLGAR